MKIVEIKDIRGNLLNNVEIPDDTSKDQEVKVALEKLVRLEAYLRRANLEGANLEGANLREIFLREANLKLANLYKADLRKAILQKANLEGANLKGANLEGANLERVNLRGADLKEANLKGATLIGANLKEVNLKWVNLEGAIIKEGISLLKDGYFTVTNIGSEQSTLEIFNTNQGLYFRRDYFFGNEEIFKALVTNKYGDSQIAKMYLLTIELAKLRFNLN